VVSMIKLGELRAEDWPAFGADTQTPLSQQWNDTRVDFPQVCTHELFQRQVARDPQATAIDYGERGVTYQELNERANRIAHYLRRRGVGPDVLVGVCLDRSPDMVAALLAVWKAGGAYVPLDPAYPPERLSFMIEDAQTLMLLTEEKYRQLLSSAGHKAILLDANWSLFSKEADDNLVAISNPSNLAYVIYTSGSTGKPKGAMITQSGLVNYLWWAIRTYAVEPGRSVPVHSSVSFDLTVTSLYPALLAGGTVELLRDDGGGAQNLLAALQRSGNRSLVKITPAHLELLSQRISPEQAANMTRAFVIGGENLVAENLALWRNSAPATRLINEYGPTETVVGCCVYEVRPEDPSNGSVPIGRPIANTQLYILDPNLQPVPVGEMGELYIGGVGVARGYLNRPQLTAERFLKDPFSAIPDARLYKSGDLARQRTDGTLEYLGRADDQVKVRGFRIELGEIEAALAAQSNVKSCVVVARDDETGNKRLVGYVVPRADVPSVEDLRTFLAETLPDYMVPTQFVYLASLPLTPNGKVDRKRLPAPSRETAGADKGGSPRTETQKAVAAIWEELLRVDGIGIDADFFDLGGHSMTATALVLRLRDKFGIELRLASLFERPTIAELSEFVDMVALTSRSAQALEVEREEFSL
jgi:amino acid adenylation domain-containing protein